ncbi:RNA polymerase subunit sigma-70 [Actinoplanes sp. LDG1-06]|uniref:RNA polymerase sigma factor n=1 Tax=Paractinoplanes ovalisporus TaxID=2810368 RepID=A0ABS2AJW9_9ACTN|nr:RNA polymerase subunit sigma-70 [Actinoplanes ovalisporus]MBM2620144.1 RNA polymerase subunit sigma-70 [Actinoplanes ovalisporus]
MSEDHSSTAIAIDESEFTQLAERHRRELQVHCYRMLGSFEDSEDLVQETYLRAWRARSSFEGRSTVRAWLYRIATNACLDHLGRVARNPIARRQPAFSMEATPSGSDQTEVPWLSPFPDKLLDQVAPADAEPDSLVIARETIELAFLVAIQHLPPQQRATLILRDVLAWSANETALALNISVASANSALQRARATLKDRLPAERAEWGPSTDPSEAERALLQQCVEALEKADPNRFAELLRTDVRVTMPPDALWILGRDAFVAGLMAQFDPQSPAYFGEWRAMPTRANRQPAVAGYVRRPGEADFTPQVLNVFRLEQGMIAEITAFGPEVFADFGLPATL